MAPRGDFFDICGIADVTFWPMWRQELSRTAGGAVQAKDMGPALWRASFTTSPDHFGNAADIEAALISRRGSILSFLAYDMRRPMPRAYPAGNFGDTGAIHTLYTADAYALRVGGLDAGFVLRRGDYLAFSYGARPSRALHMVMDDVTASAGGITPKFTVYPELRPGALVGAAITLKRPACEMILEPGQAPPRARDMVASSVTFSGVQIL